MNKIMMDGEPLEVGDRVYCLLRGDGYVIKVDKTHPRGRVIHGVFGEYDFKYLEGGYPLLGGTFQSTRTLYWQKPEITPPPKIKPKKKIKVWDWFVEHAGGGLYRVNERTEKGMNISARTIQKIDGTEREIEV